jgi:hypothetical protein
MGPDTRTRNRLASAGVPASSWYRGVVQLAKTSAADTGSQSRRLRTLGTISSGKTTTRTAALDLGDLNE